MSTIAGTAARGFLADRQPLSRPLLRQPETAVAREVTLTEATRGKLALPVTVYMFALVIPWQIYIGSLHLSISRTVLLVMVVPCILRWVRGEAGKLRIPDFAILLFCGWCTIATVQIHGIGYAVESSGMLFVETAGSYFLARCYLRTADDFFRMARLLVWIVVLLLPFAAVEAVTMNPVLISLFSKVMPTYAPHGPEIRWGLKRAQGVFEHPILFGVFCSTAVAMAFCVVGEARASFSNVARTLTVAGAAMLSLSTGPMSALSAQAVLIGWNVVLKGLVFRWQLFWAIVATNYLFLSLFSRQPPIVQFINFFAFDKGSAWQRLFIWEFGTASVMAHPWFGVGFGDWVRPDWQTSSIDMFWIIPAVRHGIPAVTLFTIAWLGIFIAVALKKNLDARQATYRTGYLIMMGGLFVAGWTVDFWAELYSAFVFLAASGAWFLESGPGTSGAAQLTHGRRPAGDRTGLRP